MKKGTAGLFRVGMLAVLTGMLILLSAGAYADFAETSTSFDPELAQYALTVAEMCYSPSRQASMLRNEGFERVGIFNDRRALNDSRHVAAYSVYERQTEHGTTEVLIAIRATGDGEWKLNLDMMPSGNYDLPYAENFFLAAEDILTTQEPYLSGLVSPVFLITGHSRGAAVANLLGARLTDRFGEENVFVYTFASPATVRGEAAAYGNIFNVINPSDIITCLPFRQWGFRRYGTDIILPVEDASLYPIAEEAYAARPDQSGGFVSSLGSTALVSRIVSAMEQLVPDPASGFTISHALSHTGEAEEGEPGMTAGEFLLALFEDGGSFSGIGADLQQAENDFTPLLLALKQAAEELGSSWISGMHIPATYGAWITAMSE